MKPSGCCMYTSWYRLKKLMLHPCDEFLNPSEQLLKSMYEAIQIVPQDKMSHHSQSLDTESELGQQAVLYSVQLYHFHLFFTW